MANSITYDGTDMSGANYGVINVRAARMAMADPKLDLQIFGTADGGESQAASLKPKRWSDSWKVVGDDRDDLRQKLDNINTLLDARLGARTLKYDQDVNFTPATLDRLHRAVTNGPLIQSHMGNTVTFALNWLNPKGIELALSATSETPTIDETPESFFVPVAADEVVEGNNNVAPVFTIENTSGGDVTAVTLVNDSRSETLRWTGVFADAEFMKIDCVREHIETSVIGDFTDKVNRMGGLTTGDPFLKLTAQLRNALTLTGFSAANLTVDFTAEFL